MPKLGRHYTEIWEDQDAGLLPATVLGDAEAPPFSFSAPVPKWDPSTLMEPDLVTEDRGHGPLTERVISALLPMPDMTVWKGVKAAEDAMEGRPGGSGAAAARREKMNVSDLESRIRDTMRYHGLLDGVVCFTSFPVIPLTHTSIARLYREGRRPHCDRPSPRTTGTEKYCCHEQGT
jgi:transcriptional adapter 3